MLDSPLSSDGWDSRIREAVRILENAPVPGPSTSELAARVDLSVFHFTRLFKAQVGMRPQHYARDYRLQHAASRLRYTSDPVAEVARDFGYAGLATFIRAFSEKFGEPPSRWRRAAQEPSATSRGAEVRLESFKSITCLARRYLGPREESRQQWADFLSRLPPVLAANPRLGLAYDDPRITAPERIRYDCAVRVDAAFAADATLTGDGFERLTTPAGSWACTDVLSAAHIAGGYAEILRSWLPRNPEWTLEGDPLLEFPRAGHVTAEVTWTVCLRVRRKAALPDPDMQDGGLPPRPGSFQS